MDRPQDHIGAKAYIWFLLIGVTSSRQFSNLAKMRLAIL